MKFFLGASDPKWLAKAGVPLFISHRALAGVDPWSLPAATKPWALDSGGFTELVNYGRWKTTRASYIGAVRGYMRRIGNLEYACPQDWMCSPPVMAKTGLSIREHHDRTVENFLALTSEAPDVNWMPILQGWQFKDYELHAELYKDAGIDLPSFDLVGIGSIALRQDDPMVGSIIRHFVGDGFKLHALGVKKSGLKMYGDAVASCDSMAWSFTARYVFKPSLPECEKERQQKRHPQTCQTCLRYALKWREEVLDLVNGHGTDAMFHVDDSYVENDRPHKNTRKGVRGTASGDGAYVATKATQTSMNVDPPAPSAPPVVVTEPVPDEIAAHWDAQEDVGAASLFPMPRGRNDQYREAS
jgi:hypothetical protein